MPGGLEWSVLIFLNSEIDQFIIFVMIFVKSNFRRLLALSFAVFASFVMVANLLQLILLHNYIV
jgi:hypothetical protein